MLKVKVRWSGFNGAPGWSNFFFDTVDGSFTTEADANPAAVRVDTFIKAIASKLPPAVTVQVQSDVEVISPTNGKMLNVHSVAAKSATPGTAVAAPYAAAAGAVINWRTAGVRNGRRVRGRTFIVPVIGGVFENNGTLAASHITDFQNAANALLTSTGPVKFGVWARPVTKDKNGNDLAVPIDGAFHEVLSANIPDLSAILRSRR